ncbi:MAG: LppX_LprAFG lipoprotein [Actinomycetota bacterium]
MRPLVAALATALALLAACSSDADDAEPAETVADDSGPAPTDPAEILDEAATAMAEVESVTFTIERTGAEVFIDDGENLAFVSADGRFGAPSSADALVTVELGSATLQVGAVAIDGTIWLTDPVSGGWEEASDSLSFDPATLFDPEIGWRALLAEDLSEVELVSSEGSTAVITGIAAAERVDVLTGGIVDEAAPVELTIDTDTDLISSVEFDVDTDDGIAEWRVELENYGAQVDVTAPPLDG